MGETHTAADFQGAAEKTPQYPAELGRMGSQSGSKAESLEPSTVPSVTTRCEGKRGGGQNRPTGVDGNRQLPRNEHAGNGLQLAIQAGDAESDVTDARIAQIRWLVERWDSLPADARDEVIRIVNEVIDSEMLGKTD